MQVLLLIIIYLTFISLGLPDSLLGSAWVLISKDLEINIAYAGVISVFVSTGTIISSLLSSFLIRKLGTIKLVILSVFLTMVAILLFSVSNNFASLIVLSIPLGLGAGAIDSALNHYVSVNYSRKHMNLLHAFWGVGATLSPLIMAISIGANDNWRNGYLTVGIIQSVLVSILFFSRKLWQANKNEQEEVLSIPDKLKYIKGAKAAMFSFLFYCAIEILPGLWGSTYLVKERSISESVAATIVSSFFFGIMAGRLLSGFFSNKMQTSTIIRLSHFLVFIGVVCLFFKLDYRIYYGVFILIGLGLAPLFPLGIHEATKRFSKKNAAKMISLQIAFAYMGMTITPLLSSFIIKRSSVAVFPIIFIVGLILLVVANELTLYLTKKL